MTNGIDLIDAKLLRALQRDCSRPVTALAEEVGLSHAPCWRRLQRLRSEGFIQREAAILDRQKLGWELELFILVKLDASGREAIANFSAEVLHHEQVIGCHIMLGNVDILLHVIARNMRDYERFFLEHLTKMKGLREANTLTVMSTVKTDGEIPI